MSVRIDLTYEGDLHCLAVHGPSGQTLRTDAPVDNQGKGEFFSPTDLVVTGLASCMMTLMAIAARSRGWELGRCSATVEKEMSAVPRRHIARIALTIDLPSSLDARARDVLEGAARSCPVAASLGPSTAVDISFRYV